MQGRLRPVDREETLGSITVSIGVAHAQGAATLESILKHADTALYAAKNGGRNCISSFTEKSG
jgi:diguanylate cyclase (GGDEF)-like protein